MFITRSRLMKILACLALLISSATLLLTPASAEEQPAATAEKQYMQLGKDTVALLNELTATLSNISDKESADAAVPRVEKMAARMQELRLRAESLPRPQEGIEQEVRTRLNDEEVRQAVQQFMVALLQLAQTDAYGSENLISALTRMVSSNNM